MIDFFLKTAQYLEFIVSVFTRMLGVHIVVASS